MKLGLCPVRNEGITFLAQCGHGTLSTTSLIWGNETGRWGWGVSRLGNSALQMTSSWDHTHTQTHTQSCGDACPRVCRCCMCLSRPTLNIICIRLFPVSAVWRVHITNDDQQVLSQHLEARHLPTNTTFAFLNVKRKKKKILAQRAHCPFNKCP